MCQEPRNKVFPWREDQNSSTGSLGPVVYDLFVFASCCLSMGNRLWGHGCLYTGDTPDDHWIQASFSSCGMICQGAQKSKKISIVPLSGAATKID